MLRLRVCLVQTSQRQNDRPARLRSANSGQVAQDVFLGVIQGLNRSYNDVGRLIELGQILCRVISRFVEAARVEERDQRGFRRWELVLARETRAGLEPLADLRVLGAGEIANDRGLAALRLAKQ